MIRKELRDKIIAYNRAAAERSEKATDMEVLIAVLGKLPWGQLKKVLTDDVVAVLNKYGVGEGVTK
jgi:hypothetical protein